MWHKITIKKSVISVNKLYIAAKFAEEPLLVYQIQLFDGQFIRHIPDKIIDVNLCDIAVVACPINIMYVPKRYLTKKRVVESFEEMLTFMSAIHVQELYDKTIKYRIGDKIKEEIESMIKKRKKFIFTSKQYLGEFEISSGEVVVSDPCYELETPFQGILENVKKGNWKAEVLYVDNGNNEIIPSTLIVYHTLIEKNLILATREFDS